MSILSPQYAGIKDFKNRDAQRLQDLGRSNTTRSNALANAVFSDSRAGQFVEQWTNLTAWSSSTAVLAQNNRCYANGQGAGSGNSHTLNYVAGTTRTIFTTVRVNAGGGGVFVGIGQGTAGANPASGLTDARGIYFDGALYAKKMDLGTTSNSSNTTQYGANDVLTVVMVLDPTWFTITAVSQDRTQEYRVRWATSSITPNNLVVFNSTTTTGTNAAWIGPLVDVPALSTPTPRAVGAFGIVGINRSVIWNSVDYPTGGSTVTANMRIALPPNYDARVPSPFALMWHGHSSNETYWGDNTNMKLVSNALNAAGFITIGFASPTTTPWGAQTELDAGYAAYKWAKENLNLGLGVFYCNSMGSIDGLLALADRRIPGIMAYIGTSPTFDLANNYNNTGQPFKAAIDTAYGITAGTLSGSTSIGATSLPTTASYPTVGTKIMVGIGTANVENVTTTGASTGTAVAVTALTKTHASADNISDYPTKTAGHDPALMTGDIFRGLPALILATSDDTTVVTANNGTVLASAITPFAPEVLAKLDLTGGHSFDMSPYTLRTSAYDIVNFAAKYTGL